MQITQSFLLALKSLSKSKMRAFLTMLGIIIGIASVIIIVSLGQGLKDMVSESFASMGTNILTVSIQGRGSTRAIKEDDMFQLAKDNPKYLLGVSPKVSITGSAVVDTKSVNSSSITGVAESYDEMREFELTDGRFIEYVDCLKREKVCVIGTYISKTLFKGNPIGKDIKINGNYFKVVGVLEEMAKSEETGSDNTIYLPYTTASKMTRFGRISTYDFAVTDEKLTSFAKGILEEKLYSVFKSDDYFNILSLSELLDTITNLSDQMMTVLSAIAAISLLVGGIGIMNIMLVSVTERTREIGIRKSLGAKRKNIMSQFVIEAATTSAVGGVLGIILGISLAGFAGKAVEVQSSPTVESISLAFFVSVAVGIIFGYLPAGKASKLNPIDALRHE